MFKILVPVDFSNASINASYYALTLAVANKQAQILLLHCYQDYLEYGSEVPSSLEMAASEEITERVVHRNIKDAEDQLEELIKQLRSEAATLNNHTHLERAFIHGLPEDVIIEEAKRFKPDLVVMGTRGESGFVRSFFGTVTTKVVQDMNIPVLTVPGSYKAAQPAKAIYASNFDISDSKAITQLQQILEPFRSQLLCVHISTSSSQQDQEKLDSLKSKLAQNHPEISINYTLLEGDNVAKALQDYVAEQQIDLIALTTHKRSSLGNILNPSLAQKLVLESEVPLLVFHYPNEEDAMP